MESHCFFLRKLNTWTCVGTSRVEVKPARIVPMSAFSSRLDMKILAAGGRSYLVEREPTHFTLRCKNPRRLRCVGVNYRRTYIHRARFFCLAILRYQLYCIVNYNYI